MRDDISVGDEVWWVTAKLWARVAEVHAHIWDNGGYYLRCHGEIVSVPQEAVMNKAQEKRERKREKNLARA